MIIYLKEVKMREKIIVNIKNIEEILTYQSKGIKKFLVPLADFCVGYDELSALNINKINTNFYLLVNRILTKDDLAKLESILARLNKTYLKGVFFEDLGVLSILNKLSLEVEKIYFPNHFGTNYASINAFLERGLDSVVVSNEITKEEIALILEKVTKDVVIQVYGYNQIMYSRRNLITNYNKEFNLQVSLENTITEKVTKKALKIKENQYGTVIFDENIYNNLELLEFSSHIKFYYINTSFLTILDIEKALKMPKASNSNSFLNQKTIYKIGDIDE